MKISMIFIVMLGMMGLAMTAYGTIHQSGVQAVKIKVRDRSAKKLAQTVVRNAELAAEVERWRQTARNQEVTLSQLTAELERISQTQKPEQGGDVGWTDDTVRELNR